MKSLSRRNFIHQVSSVAGAMLAAGCATSAPTKASTPPNIILIIDDQHSPRVMGWTGESAVKTPHLDRLAAEGVRFTSGYTNSPVCAPARHTLYTGVYPSQHGVLYNDVPMREDVPTLMKQLKTAGYVTANVGKMHNAPYHHRRDFDFVLNHEFFIDSGGISHYADYLTESLKLIGQAPGPAWSKPRPGMKTWMDDPECIAGVNWVPDDLTPENWTTDMCMHFLMMHRSMYVDRPFFLHASYFPPHHPYRPVQKYADMYDPADMELPPNFDRPMADAWCGGPGRPDHLSDDEYRLLIARYFGFVTQLDAAIGRLLSGVEALGVADNTIVIFTSDHGDMLGEHGLLYKGVMFEGSARVPFIIRWPGVQKSREVSEPVSHADLVPTLLAAAGLTPAIPLPGDDLRPLIEGDADWPERAVYSEFFAWLPFTHLMLRKGDYKIMATKGREPDAPIRYQMYNVVDDPWEQDDLARRSSHGETFETMREALMEQWERQQGYLPDAKPPLHPRSKYKLSWPPDPWTAVRPL